MIKGIFCIGKYHWILSLADLLTMISIPMLTIIYLVVVLVVVLLRHLPELHLAVQAGGLLAGEGVLGEVTGESLLVKHSSCRWDHFK